MYGKVILTFDDVYSTLLTEAVRKQGNGGSKASSTSSVLVMEEKPRGRGQQRGEWRKGGSKSRSKPGPRNGKGSREPTCWKCGKKGHLKKDFWSDGKKEKRDNPGGSAPSSSAHVVVAEDFDDLLDDGVVL